MVIAVLSVLASGLALQLVTVTTRMRETTAELAAVVQSLRILHEAAENLELHERAVDPVVRSDLADQIGRQLDQAEASVTTAIERRALNDTRARFDDYRREMPRRQIVDAGAHVRVRVALGRLLDINSLQARDAEERAAAWNRRANLLGAVGGGLILVVASALLWWVHTRVFRPMIALADVMERFRTGERTVRADERGPAELRGMAGQFNEMTETLGTQREAQIAFLGGIAHDLRTPLSAMRLRAPE